MGSCQIFVIHPLTFWKTYNLNYDYLCIISSQKKTILELQIADLFYSDLPGAVFRFKDFAGWLLNLDPSTASQRRVSDRRLCATEIFMALVVPKSWIKKLAIISRKLKLMFTTTKKKAREKKQSGAFLRHGFISRMASFFSDRDLGGKTPSKIWVPKTVGEPPVLKRNPTWNPYCHRYSVHVGMFFLRHRYFTNYFCLRIISKLYKHI